jgi:hypothetical protein
MQKQNLLQRQFSFSRNVARLISYANDYGFDVSIKEALRPPELEAIYKAAGKSWLNNPDDDRHLYSLAIDLCFFRGVTWITDYYALKPMGIYWVSLADGYVWGGDWSIRDCLHFQSI